MSMSDVRITPETETKTDSTTAATAAPPEQPTESAQKPARPSRAPGAPRAKRAASPAPLFSPARAAAAYHRVLPAALATDAEPAPSIEIDPAAAAKHVLAALPRVRALRDEIVATLPAHHVAQLDALEDLAQAAWFAHARGEIVGDASFSLEALEARGVALREELVVAADVLARRGLLDAERVREVREAGSAGDVAQHLQTLAELYTWSWGAVHNKTAVTQEEVAEAGDLAQRIFVARGLRDEAAAGAGPSDVAARVLARLARAYDECVRAVTYLRWREGDVADIAPALPKRRGPRAAKPVASTESEPKPADAPVPPTASED